MTHELVTNHPPKSLHILVVCCSSCSLISIGLITFFGWMCSVKSITLWLWESVAYENLYHVCLLDLWDWQMCKSFIVCMQKWGKCFIITNLITQSNWWECQNFVFIDPWRVGWRRTKQVQPLKVAEKYNDPNEWSRLQSGSMKSGANMTVSKWLIMVRWVYSQKWGNIWATRVFLAWTKFTLNTWFGYERVWWECSHRNLNHERWGVHI